MNSLALQIFNISPITYCHNPDYNPLKKVSSNGKDDLKILQIQKLLQDSYGFSTVELSTKHRKREKVKVRQIAMYLIRWQANASLKDIGTMYGGRDHTTVIHACNTVDDLMCTDSDYRREILELEFRITGVKSFDIPDKRVPYKKLRPKSTYSNPKWS